MKQHNFTLQTWRQCCQQLKGETTIIVCCKCWQPNTSLIYIRKYWKLQSLGAVHIHRHLNVQKNFCSSGGVLIALNSFWSYFLHNCKCSVTKNTALLTILQVRFSTDYKFTYIHLIYIKHGLNEQQAKCNAAIDSLLCLENTVIPQTETKEEVNNWICCPICNSQLDALST